MRRAPENDGCEWLSKGTVENLVEWFYQFAKKYLSQHNVYLEHNF